MLCSELFGASRSSPSSLRLSARLLAAMVSSATSARVTELCVAGCAASETEPRLVLAAIDSSWFSSPWPSSSVGLRCGWLERRRYRSERCCLHGTLRQEVVQGHCHDQPDDPGNVRVSHRLRQRALEDRSIHERDFNCEGQNVDEESTPCKAPEGSVPVEEGLRSVDASPDQVEVGQVDRGPRHQEVEQQCEVVLEGVEEVAGTDSRDEHGDDGHT